jgi:hypothetical protein
MLYKLAALFIVVISQTLYIVVAPPENLNATKIQFMGWYPQTFLAEFHDGSSPERPQMLSSNPATSPLVI